MRRPVLDAVHYMACVRTHDHASALLGDAEGVANASQMPLERLCYDVPEYDIWHMVIDAGEQGHGYGSEALDLVLDYIRTKPLGDSGRVALTCHKDNSVALGLYQKKGFVATGAVFDDEIELAMTVG